MRSHHRVETIAEVPRYSVYVKIVSAGLNQASLHIGKQYGERLAQRTSQSILTSNLRMIFPVAPER